MAKIRERIAYLEAQEQAAHEKRERRNQLMRNDLNTQVLRCCNVAKCRTRARQSIYGSFLDSLHGLR